MISNILFYIIIIGRKKVEKKLENVFIRNKDTSLKKIIGI